jgi:hypothetical protein
MRRRFAAFLGLGLACTAGSAAADEVNGTRSEKLVETSHDVRVTMAPTHAALRVRRQVYNGGDRHDQAVFQIELPPSSVAVGLATLGSQAGRPFWFQGELMEAEAAAAKYQELTGIGGYYPKDPALLSWRGQTELALQVFPCAPHAAKWVEYTLHMPTRYRGGRYVIELPRLGSERLSASATIVPSSAGDRVFVAGSPVASGTVVKLNTEEPLSVELELASPQQFAGELASYEFASGRALTRFRVAAAPQLSKVPKQARVVVLLDGSASFETDSRLGAIAAARAYLSHLEDARVEVVVFDRQLHPRHGKLVPRALAEQDLRALNVVPQNGSDFDRALMYADTLLSREPAALPKRVLVLTDARARSSLRPDALAAALATSGALLHIGVVHNGGSSLERDDQHPWSGVTRATGGLVWDASASPMDEPVEQRRVFEEWARPTALDHVELYDSLAQVDVGQWLPKAERVEPRLSEGQAGEWLGLATSAIATAGLRGELWTQPVELEFNADEQAAQRWSAMVFGSELLGELSEPEMMVLARRGGAVSPVTSYLAIEPGVRPSTEGLDWFGGRGEGIGLGGIGVLGFGTGVGQAAFDQQRHLEGAVKAALDACGGAARSALVELETTRAEIVDIERVSLDGSPSAPLEHCLREGVWAIALPAAFTSESARFRVKT